MYTKHMHMHSTVYAVAACLYVTSPCSLKMTEWIWLETSLRMYWTDLHQIFRKGRHMDGHGHDQSDLLFSSMEETLLW